MCRPNRRPSSKYHQDKDLTRSTSAASSLLRRACRSPFSLIRPEDTSLAHRIKEASVSTVANRVSSMTSSVLSSPEANASEVKGRSWRAWAQAIHRLGLPVGDPVADGQPMGQVLGPGVLPQPGTIGPHDQCEQFPSMTTDLRIVGVHLLDQCFVHCFVVVLFHDRPIPEEPTWGRVQFL
jgi:hypothetical protein